MWAIAVLAGSPGWNLLSQCSRCGRLARLADLALLHAAWAATRLSMVLSGWRDQGRKWSTALRVLSWPVQ
jgi:hypothetical protein